MWCSHCQQDVPGIAIKEDGNRICCARCSGLLAGMQGRTPVVITDEPSRESQTASAPASEAHAAEVVEALVAAPPLDDWSLDADLAAVTRMMQTLRVDPQAKAPRTSTPQTAAPSWRMPEAAPLRATKPPAKRNSYFAWPVLMLGMMAFCGGAVLLGWSYFGDRAVLWNYGLPAVLAGQALLVLGLVMQLDGLWQNSRDTRQALDELDRELADLRHATSVLTTTHTPAGQSFYAHMAEGASPHLLLADVKGQLDVIAMRLAQVKK
jgi:hypothetical protein